eukprot:GHVU01215565.1.p1 GENE.GHVU01215565.1~~GHVU01215565.1.p1  ORF type:complete len:544 (+),score=136.04 GHVU01215565.1:1813-3444(+)
MMSAGVEGERLSGQDVRRDNVMAVAALSNVLRSSLGPQGLDKMLVDDIGEVTVTNDGATVLKLLEVEHPAAKVMVDLSDLQDQEVGDGTTSVVIIAAELLKRALSLVNHGIHPTSVISGYKLAMKESVKYVKDHLSRAVTDVGREMLVSVASTSLGSKYIGAEVDIFAPMVVDAVLNIKMTTAGGAVKYPIGNINILKTQGKSTGESVLVPGYAIQMMRSAQGMPTNIQNPKIACLDFNLRQHRMQLGVQVQVDDPTELEKIRLKEKDIVKDKIMKIVNAGANVVLTTQGIDDMALKYFVEAGVMAVRRVPKKDLKNIAKATGATVCLTLAGLSGEETFSPALLGSCDQVSEERVGDWDYIFLRGCKSSRAVSLLLRGANEYMLDEVERSVHDAICAVQRTLEANAVCAGGGAVEVALSIYLEDFARTLGSRDQLAIAEFAQALEVIPKILATNAAKDSAELLAKLRSAHTISQRHSGNADLEKKWFGLDLVNGTVRDCFAAGVVEAQLSKIKMLKFATEAAITILRIDDVIKLHEPEQDPRQ